MKFIFNYYKWLYRQYNKVAMTGGNKILVNQGDGTYRPAGTKGQIIGNVVVQLGMCGVMLYGYQLGKARGKEQGWSEGFDQANELAKEDFPPVSHGGWGSTYGDDHP